MVKILKLPRRAYWCPRPILWAVKDPSIAKPGSFGLRVFTTREAAREVCNELNGVTK